ncbi:NAD(P)-dependent oxidoreductase [Acetobacter indonesiensis]|jgi:glutamate synthase (NADPH/NADH) small chain|uniref:Oxidoreductase/dihydropyrimidine dehydrogenase subunit A n=2 Tax=Acetobacter indonesiensis TaxID=104101 RepID=A0ABQ0K7H0_9PROT|nr:NAD(P)-dependent oxidoreductase [Acetobacter indonesiensis]MCI1436815.1 NAD(P)-dependent oxidoreductase [Acetobacter indonesiensis]MCI1546062.1 NAD(P)-dependent oxidoreductase [Acetobacter indonesiensis]MCI1765508.1 NAD(P)-dependent oxidoreductase [Acetobacter indonesiensis]GAN63430.1 oxidoreductase/dihydropyrimidine dehydrogenase subunit A [Acetobacter indonesiensis]GBQ61196.1 glutamate synthase small subunit [Acetobacter indonesiensis NRIC 0313]
MTTPMLKFISVAQKQPEKRTAQDRRADFNEIYEDFQPVEATEQASRCSQCGVPFCSVHCPLGNNIPDWLMLTANGRLEEAYEISSATNTFPEICGRICPQDRLCEGNCVIEPGFESVTIGAVERYITDTAFENGWVKPTRPVTERAESVGIVGAGPAGLAAAERLRAMGYQVHVYDRYDRVGGLLVYGIPGFKLEKEIVARRHALLVESGVTFHLGQGIGSGADELAFAELRNRHQAVLIATGVYKSREIGGPGAGLVGIERALDYLTASNRRSLGDTLPDDAKALDAAGKNVVVLGGGDTAMDCVRTAIRQGAKSVKCLYRRDKANMPGSAREVKNAEEEGVQFEWLAAPEAFVGDDHVTGVRAIRMKLGMADATGRQSVEALEGSSFTLEADLVIKALGFDPEPLPQLWDAPELGVSRWGTLKVGQDSFMTSLPGVFAAGDIVRGASLVVWAIRDGRDAAERIHTWIKANAPAAAVAEQG